MPPPVLGAKLRGAERAHNGTLGQQSRYVPSKFSGFRYIAALLIGNGQSGSVPWDRSSPSAMLAEFASASLGGRKPWCRSA